MAISEKSRNAIYRHFRPILGEEATGEMLSYFPAHDVEEPVTREHLDRRFAELRAEMHREFSLVRQELHTEIGALRMELHDESGQRRSELAELRAELHDEMGSLRTELHRELRRQTVWLTGVVVAVGGLVSGVAMAVA